MVQFFRLCMGAGIRPPRATKAALEKGFHVAPTGCVFVDKSVREGIVVKMVSEILRMR